MQIFDQQILPEAPWEEDTSWENRWVKDERDASDDDDGSSGTIDGGRN